MKETAQVVLVCAGKRYRRETSTMPQWAGSCWYYLRYLQPWNTERPVDPEVEKYWLPVDLYVGKHPPHQQEAISTHCKPATPPSHV